jgi:hypothetical protein
MFLKLRPFFYSFLFFCFLEVISCVHNSSNQVFFFSFLLLLFSLREGKIIGKKWRFSVLPILFTLSSIALLYLIGIFYERQIFIFLASVMHYLAVFGAYRLGNYENDQTARGMNMAATSTTIFFAYAGAYGLYLNFLVPLGILMLAYFFITLFVSFQYFSIIVKKGERNMAWLYSFVLGLSMAELAWVINFWPFGYLTAGVIALILYYMLWDIVQSYFLGILNQKRVLVGALFFSCLIVIILLTSKWTPAV